LMGTMKYTWQLFALVHLDCKQYWPNMPLSSEVTANLFAKASGEHVMVETWKVNQGLVCNEEDKHQWHVDSVIMAWLAEPISWITENGHGQASRQ
jgi:hypothetical protein